MKKKIYLYPTLTIKLKPVHKDMVNELRDKYYLNISKVLRESIEQIYKQVKDQGQGLNIQKD